MNQIDISSTPLIVVDVQNGFVNDNSRGVLPNIVSLINTWRQSGGPIIFTKFINDPDSFWRSLIGWSRLATSPETDIISELDTTGATVVEKNTYTSFTPDVASLFRTHKWTHVVICGIATDGCVLKTSVDAFEKRIIPIVISDACASHAGQRLHEAGILLLSRYIGTKQVVSINELQEATS